MLKKYPPLIFLLVATLLVVGQSCKEDPTSVGLGLLASGSFPSIQVDTLGASSYSTVPSQISTFGSDRLLLGKYSNYTALAIIQFTSLPVGVLDTVSIASATLQLHPAYHFGTDMGSLSFSGYRLTASADSATFDSLTTYASIYYGTNPILSFPRTIVDDTTTIKIPIDTGTVRSWFTTDSAVQNFGVILVPTSVSTIKGFSSFVNGTTTYNPTLIITCNGSGATDTLTYNTGSAHFVAHIDQSILETSDPQSMFSQSGVAYRGQLDFNLRTLPKAALILKANLELTLNPQASNLNSFARDTLFAYFVKQDSTIASLPVESQTLVGSNTVYQFQIANYVRAWAAGDTLQKLQFGGLGEINSLDLFALYGTLSPANVRPRLIVTMIAQ